MQPLYAEIHSKLDIYERNYRQYTKCLCRGIELPLSGRPEEVVRQVLLYFLMRECGLFPDTIDVKAEDKNLDIAIFKSSMEEDFRPLQAPLAIIEVKREETYLPSHEDQLFRYMKEQRTSLGVLSNGTEIIVYEKGIEGVPEKCCLESLGELCDLLQRVACREDVDFSTFQRASDGDVDSFIYLMGKYGKYMLHKFMFTLKDVPSPITGCCFRLQEQRIYYNVYGKYAAKKKFSFDLCEFERLLSVIY
jgi:hypothetical protein